MTTVWNIAVWITTTALGATDINTATKIILCNDSDTIIYVWLNWAAVMNKWIRLNANWDRIIIDSEPNGTSKITSINAITSVAWKVLSYILI